MNNQSINVAFNGYTNFTSSYNPSQRTTLLNTSNPAYLRYAVLQTDSLLVVYYTSSVTIPLSSIYQAVFSGSSVLTYPPVIQSQPTSSTVTHPASAYFVVSASSEIPITYQWYWQSSSLSTYVPCPVTYFTGTASAALTCSSTAVSIENNSSYYCSCSNSSGFTVTNFVNLYVL